jgi:hypothetical protein
MVNRAFHTRVQHSFFKNAAFMAAAIKNAAFNLLAMFLFGASFSIFGPTAVCRASARAQFSQAVHFVCGADVVNQVDVDAAPSLVHCILQAAAKVHAKAKASSSGKSPFNDETHVVIELPPGFYNLASSVDLGSTSNITIQTQNNTNPGGDFQIAQLYPTFLARQPSQKEAVAWQAQLAKRGISKIRKALAESSEAREAINKVYLTILRRDLDPSGPKSFTAAIGQGAVSIDHVGSALELGQEALTDPYRRY